MLEEVVDSCGHALGGAESHGQHTQRNFFVREPKVSHNLTWMMDENACFGNTCSNVEWIHLTHTLNLHETLVLRSKLNCVCVCVLGL